MKRLLPWALNFATAVSAALCLATCLLWFHSHDRADVAHWATWEAPGHRPLARIGWASGVCGRVSVSYERLEFASLRVDPLLRASTPPGFHCKSTDLSSWLRAGISPLTIYGMVAPFVLGPTRKGGPGVANDVYEARSPAWFLAAMTAGLPLLWAGRFVRRARRAKAHRRSTRTVCPSCGYDLRASRDRCPECGAVPVTNGAT